MSQPVAAALPPDPPWPARLCWGAAEVQPHERRLLVDARPVALGARAFDLLLALLRRPGALCSKHELLDAVWPGLVVEEANLTVQISTLRRALGGDCIATIPGRGYRFVARIEPAANESQVGDATPGPVVADVRGADARTGGTTNGPTIGPTIGPASSPASSPAGSSTGGPARALIGRDADLERLHAALAQPGGITLTGPAGVGKTSLARTLAQEHAAGAVWVDLAPLAAGALVLPALAQALELTTPAAELQAARLAAALGERLLLLDNAEHLVEASAALVASLLAARPALRVLVTSQQPLALADERVLRVEPLALARDGAAPDELSGAAALFIARVRAASHRFVAPPAALPLVHEICRRLDGMPLALEMAAARVPMLGLQGVRDALVSERFALLTTGYRDAAGRHRTLRAALDWSHGLLGADEQRLFRRLAVFSGGFSLDLMVAVAGEAASAEAPARWALIDTLAVLVEHSLVDVDDAAEGDKGDDGERPRYRLLETMREYAAQRLAEAGEAEALQERLARTLGEWFDRAQTDLVQRPQALREHDNARAAVAWSQRHDPALAVHLTHTIARAATFSVWRAQAAGWLDDCAPLVDDARVQPLERAYWCVEQARQHLMRGSPGAVDMARRSALLFRELDVPLGLFNALQAIVRGSQTAPPDLQALCAELEPLAERIGLPLTFINLQGVLAHAAYLRGDNEAAVEHRRRELALALEHGFAQQAQAAETNVAAALIRLGRHEEALALVRDLLDRIGGVDSLNTAYAWQSAIRSLQALGRYEEALRELPRALAVLCCCALPLLADAVPQLLLQLGRPRAAALLVAHTLAQRDADGRLDGVEDGHLQAVLAAADQARAVLGDALADALTQRGRRLDAAAADRLVADAAAGKPDAD